MEKELSSSDFILTPVDNKRLASLRGQYDENIRYLEKKLEVEISSRGNLFRITGNDDESIEKARKTLQALYEETEKHEDLTTEHFQRYLQHTHQDETATNPTNNKNSLNVRTKHGILKPSNRHQQEYIDCIKNYDMTFGIGPAGTGKTYLAVACAVEALEAQLVRRIMLVRPAVEAGERLGFLPGDLAQKIDPYCRPLFDALYEMLGFERVAKMIDRQIIEVAPLAYMRGRTLSDAFVILDEAQNTTREQMKMFLTRMGFNTTVVVTGDVTQIDLPRGQPSGLKHALDILQNIPEIRFVHFDSADVVRHSLVQRIIEAYEKNDIPKDTHR